MFEGAFTGNGNGNKMNLRIEILEGLLNSLGDGSSAKINSLRQTIRRNKTDMAEDACKSLDLMRQVFQAEMTFELQQILERHLRTTFSPALENLRRNGNVVTEEDIKCLCRSILEAAKKPFSSDVDKNEVDKDRELLGLPAGMESDVESEASITKFISYHKPVVTRGRKRGRPPKVRCEASCRAGTLLRSSNGNASMYDLSHFTESSSPKSTVERSIVERDCATLADSFYHGFLPRKDAETLLKNNGDFLVRKTDYRGSITLSLSIRTAKDVRHFIINENVDGGYYIEKHHEKTVRELLDWHMKTGTPATRASNAILKHGVDKPDWILNSQSVRMIKKLGEGAFGEVFMAEFSNSEGKVEKVAVKTMREHCTREARLKFMKEARIMRKFKHPNIVHIYGVVVDEHPLLILMELCSGGSALSFLRKNRGRVSDETKLRFAVESAAGLAYLEKLNCIHRDVAARNCLLNWKFNVKISDFGMSDEKQIIHDTELAKVPIKWLAPETMQRRIYSNKTDVWSYGVMVWEIYAEGCEPYPTLSNMQTRAKIVVQNYRMDMPQNTPSEVSKLVAKCWASNPDERPNFAKIHRTLKDLYEKMSDITSLSKSERI